MTYAPAVGLFWLGFEGDGSPSDHQLLKVESKFHFEPQNLTHIGRKTKRKQKKSV